MVARCTALVVPCGLRKDRFIDVIPTEQSDEGSLTQGSR